MELDSRTITLVGMAACMLFSLLGVMVGRGRETCPGFHYWTSANLCASFALLFIGLRDLIPDTVSIIFGNILSIAACSLVLEGARRFRGRRNYWWPGYVLGALTLAAVMYFRFGANDLSARILTLSLYLSAFSAAGSAEFFGAFRKGYRLSIGFTGVALAVHGASQLARGLYFYTHPPLTTLYAPNPVYAASMAATVLGIIAWSFGFFMINHDYLTENLREAQARAAQADLAKSEFLANVSHEIRTPMNGVIGLTDLLLETPLDRTQRDYAETVRESGMALLEIVNDLLDISKIEAGKIELEEAPFAPRELVKKTVELLAWKAQNKGLKLVWEVDDQVPLTVNGDAGRLRQVLTNLASNGVKFTSIGEVSIKVVLEDRNVLRFSVTDTGPGIARLEQVRLFERFEQVKNNQTGSGLGLAISKELVGRMGGKIGVNSIEDKGSTFWFTTPFKKQNTFENMSLRVLVVDDSVVNQRVASGLLEKIGCETRVAIDGHSALDMISREPFDLVLMDCQMPDLDGYQTTQMIRKTSLVPIVAMTGGVREEDKRKCLQAGMDGHIAKPVSLGSITEAVNLCVSNRS
jgi:signal transduction histidine kinase/CheY-like chemotaxis protein